MRIVALMVVAASLCAAGAFAQAPEPTVAPDLRTQAQELVVRMCVAAPEMSDLPDPTVHCACGARLMVADLDDRQLTIFTRLFVHYPDREAARAEAGRMIANEGYTQAEIQQIGALLGTSQQIMSQCAP